MSVVESFAATGIEEYEVELPAAFYCFEHVIALLFGLELVGEVLGVSANVIGGEAHARTSFQAMVTRQLWRMWILLFCGNRRIIGPATHPKEREYLRVPA